ncbi:hypothetical protein CPB83DRAFT_69312 [Crepidotus variabilis]|uniref:Uncharacterized protein n=1 Tax=Crepidotus variabilis TaxID=179855 RepID=A0A9P6JJ76_9AGAR|nr:hypothetical protein CPB83DRAFT_69312 [Crepidotus variabilis]
MWKDLHGKVETTEDITLTSNRQPRPAITIHPVRRALRFALHLPRFTLHSPCSCLPLWLDFRQPLPLLFPPLLPPSVVIKRRLSFASNGLRGLSIFLACQTSTRGHRISLDCGLSRLSNVFAPSTMYRWSATSGLFTIKQHLDSVLSAATSLMVLPRSSNYKFTKLTRRSSTACRLVMDVLYRCWLTLPVCLEPKDQKRDSRRFLGRYRFSQVGHSGRGIILYERMSNGPTSSRPWSHGKQPMRGVKITVVVTDLLADQLAIAPASLSLSSHIPLHHLINQLPPLNAVSSINTSFSFLEYVRLGMGHLTLVSFRRKDTRNPTFENTTQREWAEVVGSGAFQGHLPSPPSPFGRCYWMYFIALGIARVLGRWSLFPTA